jgi:hypothetical protein
MTKPSTASIQARQLSSGTIANLIHRNRYDLIDRAQQEFVAFIDRMDVTAGGPLFTTWQDAWEAFRQTEKVYDLMLAN